jgi:hypothetical protein
MSFRSRTIWSTSEIVQRLKNRQQHQFDANFVVTGSRGNGKSTLILKLLLRFKGVFNQDKHQVYSRDDVISLLKKQKFGICWDDEAINSGYKRDFQNKGQQELIKIVTAYRDNFNIYASALPFFYSLDKDLRALIFLHIHIIERGMAVLFVPIEDSVHTSDPWDTKNNARMEENWQKKKLKNGDFRFPYHKMSTFAGYYYFGDCTKKQRDKYLRIKSEKRKDAFMTEAETVEAQQKHKEVGFNEKLMAMIENGEITEDEFIKFCLFQDKKVTSVIASINKMFKDRGLPKTVMQTFKDKKLERKISPEIIDRYS